MGMTLKAARVNAGYNQAEAAKILNISVYTLSNYERGISFPDVPILKRIEQAYGVGYDQLIFLSQKYG
ncbi:helix-turn-helix transcriptional regulator [Eubacteriales bacterium OttesenSCG-928-K08]|nr:helix-turn-helix transcriptional regulator [Eubacteriales bacterium OttesenSCG-928-K08]